MIAVAVLPSHCTCAEQHSFCDYCRMLDKWAEDRERDDE